MTILLYQENAPHQEYALMLREAFGHVEAILYSDTLEIPPKSRLFVLLDDATFVRFLQRFSSLEAELFILPFASNPLAQKAYAIPSKPAQVVELYRHGNVSFIESLLRCNETIALGCVQIGKSETLHKKLWSYLASMWRTHLLPLRIATKEEQEIKTAALFIEAGNEAMLTKKRLSFFKMSDNRCKRIAAVIYAPKSIFQALRLKFLRHDRENQPLPEGVGVIKSQALHIASLDGSALDLRIDGKLASAKSVELAMELTNLRIASGHGCAQGELKESLRIQKLPTSEELLNFYAKKPLPLLPIAAEQDFAELFTKLRQNAKYTFTYALLLIISVLMATTGLFQNSAPTIIGAMILAPLMGPLVALAMGAVRFDGQLAADSFKTLTLSVVLALALAAAFAALLPIEHVTDQMAMRTHPTLLDLAVAILAGIAAAYGYANSKVGESLAGVAIAVALVPPLCVAGIGIGWMDAHLFWGALLLFLANVIGILFAAGVVFYLLGFASQRYAAAAFFIKGLMVALIVIPLWLSTRTFFAEERIYSQIAALNEKLQREDVHVRVEKVTLRGENLHVHVAIVADEELRGDKKRMVIEKIKKSLPKNAVLLVDSKTIYR